MIKKKTKIAVFDIDGTIFRSSLLIELVNGLVKAGVFPKKARKEMEADYLAWLNRVGDYDDYLGKVISIYDRHIVGKKFKNVEAAAQKVINKEKNKVYRFTRDLIPKLKRKGYRLITISGSPWYMVDKFALHIGFDLSFGATMYVKDEIFTGNYLEKDWKTGGQKLLTKRDRFKLLNFSRKDILLKRYIDSQKINVDWKSSIAVGDSGNDIPMLNLVGNPIAFNPDDVLLKKAKKNSWRIVVERKNVVYDIKKFDFIPYHE